MKHRGLEALGRLRWFLRFPFFGVGSPTQRVAPAAVHAGTDPLRGGDLSPRAVTPFLQSASRGVEGVSRETGPRVGREPSALRLRQAPTRARGRAVIRFEEMPGHTRTRVVPLRASGAYVQRSRPSLGRARVGGSGRASPRIRLRGLGRWGGMVSERDGLTGMRGRCGRTPPSEPTLHRMACRVEGKKNRTFRSAGSRAQRRSMFHVKHGRLMAMSTWRPPSRVRSGRASDRRAGRESKAPRGFVGMSTW